MFSKLITTHLVDIAGESRFASINAIRRLFNFFRLFMILIKKMPEMSEIMDAKIKDFIEHPENRVKDKDKTPNLGDIQVFVTVSQKYKYDDIKHFYVEEQLDRQVFWMIQEIPELDFENKNIKNRGKVSEEKRNQVCFECGRKGFGVTLFYYFLNKTIEKVTGSGPKNMSDLEKALDSNHGCLERHLENELQVHLKQKMLKMESFNEYYAHIGIEIAEGPKVIQEMLIKAVKNSRRKGYHGDDDAGVSGGTKLPPLNEQSEARVGRMLSKFATVDSERTEKKAKKKSEDAAQR